VHPNLADQLVILVALRLLALAALALSDVIQALVGTTSDAWRNGSSSRYINPGR
jgi:hypothetical protein